jgi:hypothetical protein
MPAALDTAWGICLESADKNYPCRDRKLGIRQDEAVELEIELAFADNAARIAKIREATREIAAARKGGVAELAKLAHVADGRFPYLGRGSREVRLLQRTEEELARVQGAYQD